MSRKIVSEWRTVARQAVGPWDSDESHSVTVTCEVADAKFDSWHKPYENGAYRVSAKWTLSGKSHTRARTFWGETAWMDARRQYNDIISEVAYG